MAPAWTRWALYLQFAASAFSIAGTELAHAMLLAGWAVYRPLHPIRQRLPAWVVAPFVAFLAVCVVSALRGSEPLTRLWWITQDYRIFIVPFLVLFALQWVDVRRLLGVLLFVYAAVSLYGIVQYYYGIYVIPDDVIEHFDVIGDRVRVRGNLSTPLTYSGILVLVTPLFFSLGFGDDAPWRDRWRYVGGGVLGVLGVLVSLTRSSVIGLAMGMLLLGLRFQRKLTLIVTSVLLVVGLAFTTALVMGRTLPPEEVEQLPLLLRRFGEIDLRSHGILTRVYFWESALLGFRDKPILGHGLNSHDPDVAPYQQAISKLHGGFGYGLLYGAPAHNVYLEVLFELGIVGLLVYLWLWGGMLAWNTRWLQRSKGSGYRWEESILWGASAGLVGSMFAGIFEDNFFDGEVQTVITMMMGLSLYVGLRLRERLAEPGGAAAVAEPASTGTAMADAPAAGQNSLATENAAVDYTEVTEVAGDEVTREQVERIAHRYLWAGTLCEGKDVIEVACGTGQGLGYLAGRARSLVAGDISSELLGLARAHYGERIRLEPLDAQQLPFPDASADVVILFEAIYYLPDAARFVQEARRVLRNGGRLLIATANKDLYDFNPSMYAHRYFGVVELSELLGAHGFTPELFGYLPVERVSWRQRLLRPVKRVVVALNLMPRTMAGKKLLKRLVFGSLVPMPAEISAEMVAYEPPVPIDATRPDRHHKVIYCVGTKTGD